MGQHPRIQFVELKGYTDESDNLLPYPEESLVPVYTMRNAGDMYKVKYVAKIFAEKGIIINLHSDVINKLDKPPLSIPPSQKRQFLKPMTTHNDKMGVNWRMKGEMKDFGYYTDHNSKHFKTAYTEFLSKAIAYLRPLGPKLANYVQNLDDQINKTHARAVAPTSQQQFMMPSMEMLE